MISFLFALLSRNQREGQILECLQLHGPIAPMEIVKKIYVDTPESLYKAAEKNVGHHLAKLCKEGKAKEVQNGQYKAEWEKEQTSRTQLHELLFIQNW